jgi:hypothetical protein
VLIIQAELLALRYAFGCLAECLRDRGALDVVGFAQRLEDAGALHADQPLREALGDVAAEVRFHGETQGDAPAAAPASESPLRLVSSKL